MFNTKVQHFKPILLNTVHCSMLQVELPLREPLLERKEPRFDGEAVGVASPSLSNPSALRSIFLISFTHSVLVSLLSAGAWTHLLMSGSNGLSSSLRMKDILIVWMKWSRRASLWRLKAYSWFHSSQAIKPKKLWKLIKHTSETCVQVAHTFHVPKKELVLYQYSWYFCFLGLNNGNLLFVHFTLLVKWERSQFDRGQELHVT